MSIISQFRLLIPEEIELSSEDYVLARELSNNFLEEELNWQSYLNALGALAFEHWLNQRASKLTRTRNFDYLDRVAYLEVNGFKLCLLAREDFLAEEIIIAKELIDRPELAAHFYGIVEVVEELELCTFRGISQRQQLTYHEEDTDNYRLMLDDFDPELNHFLANCRYLQPTQIELPQEQIQEVATKAIGETATKLGQWLEGVVSEGWQRLDRLLMPEAQLAFATRNLADDLQWGKIIDLGLNFGEQKAVLLITLNPVEDNKIRIQVRLVPFNRDTLPPNLQLNLKSRSAKVIQSVETRQDDNYIQLKPFKSQRGKIFQLEVSGDGFAISETFEL